MERILERIFLSVYKGRFILKGGMLVAMARLDARFTMELEAAVKGANVSVENVENIISSIQCLSLSHTLTTRISIRTSFTIPPG